MKKTNRTPEQTINYIKRMIEENGLTNESEIEKFVAENILGKNPEELPNFDLNDKDIARNLVFQAQDETDENEVLSMLEEALFFDKNCTEAYLHLASLQKQSLVIKILLQKAISIGKKQFPKTFIEEHREHLYTHTEIRPYLIAMFQLSEIHYLQGDLIEAKKAFKKLLKMCPNDNLGAREIYGLVLLELENFKAFKKLQDAYNGDVSVYANFNKVYYSFYNDNDLEKTKYLLEAAKQQNKHVVKKLLNNSTLKMENSYEMGSVSEANNYCSFAREIWQNDLKLIYWLKQNQ